MDYVEVTVFVLVDGNGDYIATHDSDRIDELYDEDIGGEVTLNKRLVEMKVKVPTPRTQIVHVTLPVEPAAKIEVTAV